MQRQPEGIPLINQMEYVEEVLSNLKPDTTYTFTITVENGVSDQDTRGKDLQSCKFTTTTMEGSMLNQNCCCI